ncbi:MAG TPA: cell division protein FtsZ [Bryobacteraceae bacterium]|nr:cell division protein FtsZ [Bryobacteraceae bacterium]
MSELKFEMQDDNQIGTRIKVIGVGGGGCNAVARMMTAGLTGVDFYVVNTDVQALNVSPVPNKIAIGGKLTNGLGAGSDPEKGRQAALDDTNRLVEILEDADMVFLTSGLGGGTGTGATPVVASLAKELGALTVAIVTMPFKFEGPKKIRQAERGLADLAATIDTVISIPNDRLMKLAPKGTSFLEAFKMADDVLRQAVQGISEIMLTPGIINRDFSDIKAIMSGMGHAMMGTATATGEGAAVEAARASISSPLLEENGVEGARGLLINVAGSSALTLDQFGEACSLIFEATKNDEVHVSYGLVHDEALGDEVKVTVIATGFTRESSIPLTPSRPERFPAAASPIAMPAFSPEPVETAFDEVEVTDALPSSSNSGEPAPPPPPAAPRADADPFDDIDTPAFLRRERKLFS